MSQSQTSKVENPVIATRSALEQYRVFLSGLKHRRPKELVLIAPQLVPEKHFDVVIARNQGYYAFPPVGLLYISSVTRFFFPDIKVHILDLNYELLKEASTQPDFQYGNWKKIVGDTLKTCEAPHIGITYMFGSTKPVFTEITAWLRNRYPDCPILAGGVQATYDYKQLLESRAIDLIFRRESEKQYELYLKSCDRDNDESVPWGAAYQLEGQVYMLGEASLDNPEVDWDIRPDYDKIEIGDYHKYGSLAAFSRFVGDDKPFATVLSNRGCRARCTFCTVRNFNGFGVRGRSIRNVVDEIKYLYKEKGIRQIDWLDDDLLWDPARAVEMFKLMAAEIPDLEWISNNGLIASAITDEIMEWMVRSGMRAFKIGIETGNDEMLHKVKKPATKPKLRVARERFLKFPEVFVSANFIIGFPREIFGQMMDSFDFADELKWDWSSFYICQPLKGTEIFSAFQELGDERAEVESYDKTLNPGRSAARGEFGYFFDKKNPVATGRAVFDLPRDSVPSQDQLKEIWFTFNLVANFINNINFTPAGRPEKLMKWLRSIAYAYPYDASMVSALCRGYRLMGDEKNFRLSREKFIQILSDSRYWQMRTRDFPELLEYAGVSESKALRLSS